MRYGRINNCVVQYAPKNFKTDEGNLIVNFNLSEELMLYYGFKKITEVKPLYDTKTQYLRMESFIESSKEITIYYEVVDKVIEVSLENRVKTLEAQLDVQQEILDSEINN